MTGVYELSLLAPRRIHLCKNCREQDMQQPWPEDGQIFSAPRLLGGRYGACTICGARGHQIVWWYLTGGLLEE